MCSIGPNASHPRAKYAPKSGICTHFGLVTVITAIFWALGATWVGSQGPKSGFGDLLPPTFAQVFADLESDKAVVRCIPIIQKGPLVKKKPE